MKRIYPIVVLLVFLTAVALSSVTAQTVEKNYLHFKTPKKLHRFFAYKPSKVIISGHRGTIESGLPENSIAAFEEVLRHTPAIFEIDPRMTKDSVVVLMHDATLDRTTNGKGKVSEHTWAQLQQLRLKDKDGRVTEHGIPTLEEVINWARGKTVLNLDQKGVPADVYLKLIDQLNASTFVMITVHSPEQAWEFLSHNKNLMLSAHIKTPEVFEAYKEAKVPFNRMIAYIGPHVKPENKTLYRLLNTRGTMCMISSAPTYDKLASEVDRAEAYRSVVADGASILESDFPIEVARAFSL